MTPNAEPELEEDIEYLETEEIGEQNKIIAKLKEIISARDRGIIGLKAELAAKHNIIIDLQKTIDNMEIQRDKELSESIPKTQLNEMREALIDMFFQFAYKNNKGYYHAGGLSALENAFKVLGLKGEKVTEEELLNSSGKEKGEQ